jgi:drug/metabolite transporter (DMT)-like permease
MTGFYVMLYFSVILAAAGQVLLKFGVGAGGLDLGILRLNRWIFLGMCAMVLCVFISVRGLSVVPLRDLAFILPAVYIAVPVFSRIFLKEKIKRRTIIGTLIMIAGSIVFNIPMIRLLN